MHRSTSYAITLHFPLSAFFFFNDTATTEIYTLSLHDALPIFAPNDGAIRSSARCRARSAGQSTGVLQCADWIAASYRSEEHTSELQSQSISYAVFCLKKKKYSKHPVHVSIPRAELIRWRLSVD